MAGTDDLRVGDAEREAVAAELREHYAQGRLQLEELHRRLDAALAAKTRGDLDQLTADLPSTRPPSTPLPAAGGWRPRRHGPHFGSGGFGYGEQRHARIGRFTSLLAAVASIVIVFVVMAGLTFTLPGRLGVLLALFAIIRGLLRWIFGGFRRRF